MIANVFLLSACIVWLMLESSVHLYHGTKIDRSKDNGTQQRIYLISALTVAGMISSALVLSDITLSTSVDTVQTIGAFIMLLAAGLRFWAIQTLGTFFKTTVMIQKKHQIIRSGPYTVLRHPSYTGAYFGMIGFAIALNNWVGLFIAICLGFYSFWQRIQTEEKVLKRHFGKEFTQYEHQTKKMIPFIW